jgi:23S rRNA (pseudouridine1915-N3)-methyltransferase
MWEIKILTVGKIRNKAIKEEVDRLVKSVRGEWKVDITAVPDSSEKNATVRKRKETRELISKIPKNSEPVPLTPEGKMATSEKFAADLKSFKDEGRKICFLIGGAHGLDPDFVAECGTSLSLSKMTFSHELSLLVLMEQVYRGYTLYNNIPYSK